MKKIILVFYFIVVQISYSCAQNTEIKDMLMGQGAWFLFSSRTDENLENEAFTKIDFYKKQDVSSILFDDEDKLYSVFSQDGTDIFEDRWRLVDDTHFVMVSPIDESVQLLNIEELTSTKLVIKNCSEIEKGTQCVTYTYFSTKSGWLPDKEIDELNAAGVIKIENKK